MADRDRRISISLAVTLVVNIAAWLFTYGRLTQQVDDLQREVQELRALMLRHIEEHGHQRMTLPKLGDTALQYPLGDPQFTPLVADTLGDHGTARDGFDALLSDTATPLESEIESLVDLDTLAAEADFPPGDFKGQTLSPMAADFASFVSDGDKVYQDTVGGFVGDAFSNPDKPLTPPPDSSPPPDMPPSAGGGGGGGGGTEPGGGGEPTPGEVECELHPERPECAGRGGGEAGGL